MGLGFLETEPLAVEAQGAPEVAHADAEVGEGGLGAVAHGP